MKAFRLLAFTLFLLAPAMLRAADACNGNCLPTGAAIETGNPVLTEDYNFVRVSGWCQAGASCVGTLNIEANTCPSCPFITQQSFTPSIPDANGLVTTVFLEPRMYSYRCRIGSDYSAGIFQCRTEIIR